MLLDALACKSGDRLVLNCTAALCLSRTSLQNVFFIHMSVLWKISSRFFQLWLTQMDCRTSASWMIQNTLLIPTFKSKSGTKHEKQNKIHTHKVLQRYFRHITWWGWTVAWRLVLLLWFGLSFKWKQCAGTPKATKVKGWVQFFLE